MGSKSTTIFSKQQMAVYSTAQHAVGVQAEQAVFKKFGQ